jgi:thiosulfate reductase cytochrome b subunit
MTSSATKQRSKLPIQALPAKAFHWINIISLILMIGSGLQIYNANPVFGGREGWHFPEFLLLGGWLAGGRDWHFAIMWIYALNLLGYGLFIFLTRRWQNRFASGSDFKALRVSQNEKRKRYAWHRLVYTAIVPVLLLAIATGLAMYKPAQLHWLAALFGDWQTLRTIHFITVPIVLCFTLVHSLMALRVGSMRLVKSIFL